MGSVSAMPKRDQKERDRTLTTPRHFHATIFTFVTKDNSGNFVDSCHHEVMGRSVESCIRKAVNRGEAKHEQYHLMQLTECAESTHSPNMED